jgi:putative flippase GtrA
MGPFMSEGVGGRLTPLLRAVRRASAARYAITGVALLVLDICVFFVLARLFMVPPAAAQLVARSVGAAAGFFGHKNFSFKKTGDTPGAPLRQVVPYVLLTLTTIGVSPVVLIGLLALLDNLVAAKLGTEVVMVALNYFCLRRVFR